MKLEFVTTSYWLVTGIDRTAPPGSGPIIDEQWSTLDEAVTAFRRYKEELITKSAVIKEDSDDTLITDKYVLDIVYIPSIEQEVNYEKGE